MKLLLQQLIASGKIFQVSLLSLAHWHTMKHDYQSTPRYDYSGITSIEFVRSWIKALLERSKTDESHFILNSLDI